MTSPTAGATTGAPAADRLTARRAGRHGRVAVELVLWAAPGRALTLVVLAGLAGLVPVAAAWLLKLLLDWLAGPGPAPSLLLPALALAVLGVAAAVLPRAVAYTEAELGRSVKLLAFDRVFSTVNARLRGLARLEDPRFQDRLRLAVTTGSAAPGQVVGNTIGLAQGALTLAGFVTTLAVLSPWLALAVTATALPTLRAEVLLSRRRVGAMWRLSYAERRQFFYSNLLSTPQEAKEVRLFGLGDFFQRRMLTELRTANVTERDLDRRELYVQAVAGVLGAVSAGAGLVWAVHAARSGRLGVGDVSVFVAAVAGVQGGLSDLISRLGRLHESLLMLDHYQAVLTVEPDLPAPAPAGTSAVRPLRAGLELRDVWFRYGPGHPWVLRGVNLSLPAGRSLALVGLNGAGKSTIVKLLCRLYDPSRGQVLWDGSDVRDLDPGELRARIGVVFQDYVEYELSAAENIGLGDLAALHDLDRIQRAAERAGVHDTLAALPAGYATLLTRLYLDNADRDDPETGVLLSGGQGQRLALARAFHRGRRDLLVLDEPSAGLDAEAEAAIHDQVRTYWAAGTCLLISHRLNTVRNADQIAVLSGGRISEQGDHAGLLAAGGEYARLFGLQARGYLEPTGAAG